MYFLTHSFDFEAAHFLRDYKGKCANMHGHTYKVELSIKGEKLQANGILVDFSFIKKVVNEIVVSNFDHKVLNEVMDENPTAENLARLIYDSVQLQFAMNGFEVSVDYVRVWETSNNSATYKED